MWETYFRKKECARSPPWRRCSARRGKRPEVRRRSLNAGLGLIRVHPLFLLYDPWPSDDEIPRRRTTLASSSRSQYACFCFFNRSKFSPLCMYIFIIGDIFSTLYPAIVAVERNVTRNFAGHVLRPWNERKNLEIDGERYKHLV